METRLHCNNPAEAGTSGTSADALKSNGWLRDPDFLRTEQFPFVRYTGVVDNIKLGDVTKEQDIDSSSSLAASSTQSVKEKSIPLIPFDQFSLHHNCFGSPHKCYVFYHLTKLPYRRRQRNGSC